jgi:hypothetical protein
MPSFPGTALSAVAEAGCTLARDTPLARVLPWRILEFQRR